MKQNPTRQIFMILFSLALFVTGCARMPIQEISDARVLMEAARNSCAKTYMPEEMEEGEKKLARIAKAEEKKIKLSKKEIRIESFDVQQLAKKMINQSARIKSDIYAQIQQEILLAIKKIHDGEKAEANRYARQEYKLAIENVRQARMLSQDECRYKEALEKSEESVRTAEACIQKAITFKSELETNLPVYHIVSKGETLKSIAKNSPLYRNEDDWELIYKANRNQIRDPKILYPGQQLYLPNK